MVWVRIAEGDITDPAILIEADWPEVPRIGEKIRFQDPEGNSVFRPVRDVFYSVRVSKDLISATCMV